MKYSRPVLIGRAGFFGCCDNDGRTLRAAEGAAASATIGIPIRNMHTQVDVADLRDAEDAARMLTHMILELPEALNFPPIDFEEENEGEQRATAGKESGRYASEDRE